MAKSELLGHRTCPLCNGRARMGLMKTGCVCLTCDACNMQLFTRSGKSDQLVRDLAPAPDAATPQPAKPAPAAAPAPAPKPVTAAPAPAPATTTPETPAPVRTEKRSPFSIF